LLHRLLGLLPRIEARRLQVKLHRASQLVAATSRPPPSPLDDRMMAVAARLRTMGCWILVADETRFLLANRLSDGDDWIVEVDRPTAAVVELLLEGAAPIEVDGLDQILENLGGG